MRALAAFAILCVGAAPAVAQQPSSGARPTPEQARAMLQARPDLVEQLRQRFVKSGMTRDQIHARLLAEGYPEDLLDPYLPGGSGNAAAPSDSVYAAVQQLGIADSSDIAIFRAIQADSLPPGVRDSLFAAGDSSLRRNARQAPRRVRTDVADSLARLDSGYNIFGIEMFRSTQGNVQPVVLGPVDDNYRLGPGDRLVLILTGDVEASYTLDVNREGFIVIPQVGQLYIGNLTLGQLNDVLYSRLGRVYSGVRRSPNATTKFSVSVARLRTNQVYVLGEVERPGSYLVSSAGTALTSLYAAGGPTANASLRNVQIKRAGRTVSTVDLYDYLLRGDASKDARLETGDIVFVPPHGMRVRIIGEVIRPATYELKEGETLADVIAAAGGFRADAQQRRVQIERILPPGERTVSGKDRVTIEITSNDVTNGGGHAVPLEGGDVVRVFPVAKRLRNTITVQGNVWTPGQQGLTEGMMLSQAIRVAGGPKPDVYLGEILVSRLQPDSSRVQLRAAFRDSTGQVVGDFPLREDDVVQVFSLTDFRPDRYVAIGGSVKKPGRFPYRSGITVRDLVLLAGGLQEGAYLKEAEIARLPSDRSGTVTARTVRVPLDSTYLFERRPGEAYIGTPGLQAPASGAPEIELQPYDNVLILKQPGWELQRVVTLTGEVRFPGQYALQRRDERISDLIARAGGFTPEADEKAVVFVRRRGGIGRIAVDVPLALRQPGSPENLYLNDGDDITVPKKINVVTVRGFVNAPTVVAYVPGKNIDYYIEQAGGYALKSSPQRAYVTQPNGKRETVKRHRFFPDQVPKPFPGAVVVVPEKAPEEQKDYVAAVGAVAQLLTSLIAIVITVKRL